MQVQYEKLTGETNSLFLYKEFIQNRFTSPLHVHDEYELILIHVGEGTLFVGTETFTFLKGQVFMLAPGVPHCFINNETQNKAHAVVVQFREDFLGKTFFESEEARELQPILRKSALGIRFLETKSVERDLIDLRKHSGIARLQKLLRIFKVLSELRFELLGNELVSETNKLFDSQIIKSVYNYVISNFKRKITLKDAANSVNMKSSAFCRYFKRKTKITFSDFVNQIRLAHAKKLLLETDMFINEIGFECGFGNISYFNRRFKEMYGVVPGNIRDRHKKLIDSD